MMLHVSWRIVQLVFHSKKLGESSKAELSSIYQIVWTDRELYEAEVHACLFTLLLS